MRKVTKLIILVLSVMMVGLVIPANSESVRFDNLNLSLSVKYNETEIEMMSTF